MQLVLPRTSCYFRVTAHSFSLGTYAVTRVCENVLFFFLVS
jgi:hypothetical protein